MRFANNRHLAAIVKKFPGAHVEICRNGLASWEYVGKSDTKLEGPLTHGEAPPAKLNQAGDKAKRNQMLIAKGAEAALEDGDIGLKDYAKFKQAIELYKTTKAHVDTLDSLDNYWFYGASGVGKSRMCRARWPGCYIKSPETEWWTGYNG